MKSVKAAKVQPKVTTLKYTGDYPELIAGELSGLYVKAATLATAECSDKPIIVVDSLGTEQPKVYIPFDYEHKPYELQIAERKEEYRMAVYVYGPSPIAQKVSLEDR